MSSSALGEDAMTHRTCKKWFQRFRKSDFHLFDRKKTCSAEKIRRRGNGATPGGKPYSKGKRTRTRPLNYSARNFPSHAPTRKNSRGRSMAKGTELICRHNELSEYSANKLHFEQY